MDLDHCDHLASAAETVGGDEKAPPRRPADERCAYVSDHADEFDGTIAFAFGGLDAPPIASAMRERRAR